METTDNQNSNFSCISAICSCLVLSVVYVASLYVWNLPHDREHPSTIKRRFFSVFIVTLTSPASLYFGLNENVFRKATIWELLGLRWPGLIQATIIPLCLTMVLFLGPLSMLVINRILRLHPNTLLEPCGSRSLIWLRDFVIAPLSEEWTFRACMLPLLLQCFSKTTAIFICPLFFGAGHFHHIFERMKMGIEFKHALIISCFQCAYTTVFGTYAAFLFVRTGHFVAPFAAHSFCNYMGLPNLSEIATYENPLKRAALISLFLIGLVAWCLLLTPLTNPTIFNNNLF